MPPSETTEPVMAYGMNKVFLNSSVVLVDVLVIELKRAVVVVVVVVVAV